MNFPILKPAAARRRLVSVLALGTACLYPWAANAQDSAFLDCARHEDRGQRIACLEDALEAAIGGEEAYGERVPASSASPETESAAREREETAAPEAAAEEPSLAERLRSFGRTPEPAIEADEEGEEELHDTIAGLEQRRGLWIVTLGSGQVWQQVIPRRLNLREGDEIRIYQEGIGNGYRLAAKRLSGFIRVERVQ